MSKVGNSVSFIGRFGQAPELKQVNDTFVCNFNLGRNRDYIKDKEHPETDWVSCVAWGKTAELICKYFDKGSRIGVQGSLQTRKYENSANVQVKVTEIFVENIEFIDYKKDSNNTEEYTDKTVVKAKPAKKAEVVDDAFDDDNEDLPF